MRNGGQLDSGLDDGQLSRVSGSAGDININASLLSLNDRAQITVATTGDRGNIRLNTDRLFLNNSSGIIASGFGRSSGGEIRINANTLIALNSSKIATAAERGDGGDITITTNGFIRSPESVLDASSQSGSDGTIEIRTPDSDPVGERAQDSGQPVDVTELVSTKSCTTRRDGSSFFMVGRGGLRESPLDPLPPDLMWEDWETFEAMMHLFDHLEPVEPEAVSPTAETDETPPPLAINQPDQSSADRSPASDLTSPLVGADHTTALPKGTRSIEARGWMQQADGTVTLLSQAVTPTAQGSFLHPHDCQLLQEGLRINQS